MDTNFRLRIQRRSRARPQPVLQPRDPVKVDIEKAFCAYVVSTLSTALGSSYSPTKISNAIAGYSQMQNTTASRITAAGTTTNSHLVHLEPPSRLTTTGCWCPNPSIPRQHYWRTCPRFVPQAIVAPSASVQPCRHHPPSSPPCAATYIFDPGEPPERSTIDHLFCFDPIEAASLYMSWFLAIPGPPDTPPDEQDATYLGRWLIECYYSNDHYRSHRVPNPYLPFDPHIQELGRVAYDPRWETVPATDEVARAHFAMLSRLFMELRGSPPKSNRAGCWYDAERVHAIIRWEKMGVQEAMDAFLPFVLHAKAKRLQGTRAANVA
ncbi:hypothetical protein NQ176_g3194 [Zarea fungicola]|uniref:Uncharacterized protein n=1 Tax=Zarea fungicola TaxID=93591 RepID=A0ACC1NKC5_9HYPO|nr:hypothetical protein NQ176_g3194 [Lecanicillium fungicola]